MIKRRKLIKILTRDFGCKFIRQAKGTHEVYKSAEGWAIIHVCDEIPEGTMLAILEQLKVDKDEFKKRLK